MAPQESPLITRALPPQRPCLAPVPCPQFFFVQNFFVGIFSSEFFSSEFFLKTYFRKIFFEKDIFRKITFEKTCLDKYASKHIFRNLFQRSQKRLSLHSNRRPLHSKRCPLHFKRACVLRATAHFFSNDFDCIMKSFCAIFMLPLFQ